MKKRLLFIIIINVLIINLYTQVVCAAPQALMEQEIQQPKTKTETEQSTQTTESSSKGESADTDTDINIDDVFSGADSFLLEIDKDQDPSTDTSDATAPMVGEIKRKLEPFSISLSNMFITIGTILAVIYASVLGIKFMMGAAEEKAEVKESLIPFVVGCAVIYGAFFIWKVVINIGKSF